MPENIRFESIPMSTFSYTVQFSKIHAAFHETFVFQNILLFVLLIQPNVPKRDNSFLPVNPSRFNSKSAFPNKRSDFNDLPFKSDHSLMVCNEFLSKQSISTVFGIIIKFKWSKDIIRYNLITSNWPCWLHLKLCWYSMQRSNNKQFRFLMDILRYCCHGVDERESFGFYSIANRHSNTISGSVDSDETIDDIALSAKYSCASSGWHCRGATSRSRSIRWKISSFLSTFKCNLLWSWSAVNDESSEFPFISSSDFVNDSKIRNLLFLSVDVGAGWMLIVLCTDGVVCVSAADTEIHSKYTLMIILELPCDEIRLSLLLLKEHDLNVDMFLNRKKSHLATYLDSRCYHSEIYQLLTRALLRSNHNICSFHSKHV